MKTRTALALVLATFVTTACGTSDDVTGGTGAKVEIRHVDNTVEGTLTKNDVSIEFKIEDNAHLVISTSDHFRLVDSMRTDDGKQRASLLDSFSVAGDAHFSRIALHDLAAMPEAELIQALPGALALEGIDIGSLIDASPALTDVFCPTREAFDPLTQSGAIDLDRN